MGAFNRRPRTQPRRLLQKPITHRQPPSVFRRIIREASTRLKDVMRMRQFCGRNDPRRRPKGPKPASPTGRAIGVPLEAKPMAQTEIIPGKAATRGGVGAPGQRLRRMRGRYGGARTGIEPG